MRSTHIALLSPILMASILVARVAHAQVSVEQLARCAAISAAARRLQCFDALAKARSDSASRSAQGVPVGESRMGNWIVSVETDPITDQKSVTFFLAAEGVGRFQTRRFIIRCKSGDIDAYVAPDEYLASEQSGLTDEPELTIRFGSEPPVRERWSAASDHSAAFYPGDRAAVEAFVRKLTQYDRVAIEVTPYQKVPVAMVFRLTGIDQVNRELWRICPAPQPESDSNDLSTVFSESMVEEKPSVLSATPAVFPELLKQAGIQGRVIVQAIIDTSGRAEPGSVKIIQSPNPGFDQGSRNYVLHALFRPARLHGRAARVLIQIPIDYKVNGR